MLLPLYLHYSHLCPSLLLLFELLGSLIGPLLDSSAGHSGTRMEPQQRWVGQQGVGQWCSLKDLGRHKR